MAQTGQYAGAGTTAAQRHLAPQGVGGVKMETIDSASKEVKALIFQLNRFANATTLDEHRVALESFDDDLTLDTPFITVQGKERVRVLTSLAKFFLGHFDIEPRLVKISVPESGAKEGKLDVDGIVHWLPHRPWFLPLTLLLPRDIPIYADVSMTVKAHNDKVFNVSGKNHNLPHVPRILRIIAGYVAGLGVSVAEPAYNNLVEWYHAGIENVSSATATARETAARGTDYVKETVGSGTTGVRDIAGRATDVVRDAAEGVKERVQPLVDRAAETVGIKAA